MTGELDRDAFLRLLERLGDESDEQALAAARDVHAQIASAGVSWDELLVPEGGAEPKADHRDEDDALDEADDRDEDDAVDEDDDRDEDDALDEGGDRDEDQDEDEDQEATSDPSVKDAEALKLIERLLEKSGLRDETRAELRDYKKDIAAGEFDAMDGRYLKALASRLSKRK